jgi:molybdopterin synthase catalytic subunit
MITLLYFAAVREQLGRERDTFALDALPPSATIADLWDVLCTRHPQLATWRPHLRFALNMELCEDSRTLTDGDEVAIIPPVSGGIDPPAPAPPALPLSDPTGAFCITDQPLDPRRCEALVAHTGAGALVTFTGMVRDHTGDHAVRWLEYEAYAPMALRALMQIADEVRAAWPHARISIHHRVGKLELGEAAVAVATATAHRAEAFAACQHAIDRLKQIVPIWKKEIGHDGQHWVGMGP